MVFPWEWGLSRVYVSVGPGCSLRGLSVGEWGASPSGGCVQRINPPSGSGYTRFRYTSLPSYHAVFHVYVLHINSRKIPCTKHNTISSTIRLCCTLVSVHLFLTRNFKRRKYNSWWAPRRNLCREDDPGHGRSISDSRHHGAPSHLAIGHACQILIKLLLVTVLLFVCGLMSVPLHAEPTPTSRTTPCTN
jgi:hypothetical protein